MLRIDPSVSSAALSHPTQGMRIIQPSLAPHSDRPRAEQKHPDSKALDLADSRGIKCPTLPIEVSEHFDSPRASLQHTESRSQGKV